LPDRTAEIWDVIIVGRGLAGTTLAWHLVEAGKSVLLTDADEAVTSSKIAAGLITPITGQRFAPSWRCNEFMPVARTFYRRIEERTGARFFHERTAIRLFQSDEERALWEKQRMKPAIQPYMLPATPDELIAPGIADTGAGGFAMRAAQLDVAAYLDASRNALPCDRHAIDWTRDVQFDADAASIAGHRAHLIISCEGAAAARNPYFAYVPLRPAKGDILTLRFAAELPPHSVHRGVWLAPTGDPHIFRAGSTYDREHLNQTPTEEARAEIEDRLRTFLRIPYEVIGHVAALRPVLFHSRAIVGLHPEQDRLGCFNGLGSKGSLHAPWYAERFAAFIAHGAPLPADIDLRRSPLIHAARH
jgi:glycine/D-amino acid oxidase-like deaminating enzyme